MPSRSKEFLTVTATASAPVLVPTADVSAPGPSTSTASPDKQTKRTRKRTRNKKRTADDDNTDPESDAEAGQKPADVAAKEAQVEPKVAVKADTDNEGDEDQDGKRKRKRKRATKKKLEGETAQVGASEVVDVGPDVRSDLRLSEQAKQAISYAQTFTSDKTQWKFNKARQNWLLRNALSVPPADYDAALARTAAAEPATTNGDDGDEESENFVPDDLVPVVAAYLKSVLGGAKLRLVEMLKEALKASEVSLPAPVPEDAVPAASAISNGTSTTSKSVSFADMAMQQESAQSTSQAPEDAPQEAAASAGPDARTVELKRKRARFILQRMGESI